MLTLVLVLPAAVSQSDMAAERVVRKEDGEKLAKVKVRRLQSCRRHGRRGRLSSHVCSSSQEYGVPFMESSAKTGANVELAFLAIAK